LAGLTFAPAPVNLQRMRLQANDITMIARRFGKKFGLSSPIVGKTLLKSAKHLHEGRNDLVLEKAVLVVERDTENPLSVAHSYSRSGCALTKRTLKATVTRSSSHSLG
jgi:hypothetical protein